MGSSRTSTVWVLCSSLATLAACSAASDARPFRSGAAGSTAVSESEAAGSSSSGTGGTVIVDPGGRSGAAGSSCICDRSNPEAACNRTPPGCGDGLLQNSEECDDGNSAPGDGCSGICKIEPYYKCSTPGTACVSTIVCGDGKVARSEGCDDGNRTSGDGCSEDCNLELGFACKVPGKPCVRVFVCGDGQVDANEGCDDANEKDGDGCDSRCRVELGFKCSGSPSGCTPTSCGDKKVEGAESCDDGNGIPFDGCSANCQAEPKCPTTGACTSTCGDGIVLGAGEECDDGNLRDGDGCSHDCKVEAGFVCKNDVSCDDGEPCSMTVPVIYRDFNFHDSKNGHPDFQPGYNSGMSVVQGLVQATWDADKKPVLTTGKATCVSEDGTKKSCSPTDAYIHTADGFAEWYRDGARNSGSIPDTIRLWDNGKGGFVNRFDPNGAQWVGESQGGTTAAKTKYDGNPLFFPIDPPKPKILDDKRLSAKIPEQYGFNGWPFEMDKGPGLGLKPSGVKCDATDANPTSNWCHNFGFTTEVKYWFKYSATEKARLDFTGDDDVWVFINGKLAVDLGGWHVPLDGTVTVDKTTAATYGLADGQVFEVGVFQTERETEGSTFRLTLSGFRMSPSDCHPDCGDGVIAAGEQCDDGRGNNTGAYNHCSTTCSLGPRCGDGEVQTADGEECDDGKNIGAYDGCGTDCKKGPHCGDGVVQSDREACDDGTNDGSYGTCNPDCTIAPRCGDGIVQAEHEQCEMGEHQASGDCNAALVSGGCTVTCQWAIVN